MTSKKWPSLPVHLMVGLMVGGILQEVAGWTPENVQTAGHAAWLCRVGSVSAVAVTIIP